MLPRLAYRWLAPALLMLVAPSMAAADSSRPSGSDPMGPLSDATAHWRDYQPASSFCIKPTGGEYTPGGVGPTTSGRDPACRRSGFGHWVASAMSTSR